MTWLLLKLLPGALRYTDGGERQFILHAAIALVLDVIVAHTTFAVIAGWPRKGEWTVSQMLERLCVQWSHPDRMLFVGLARHINRISPTRDHIKAVL